MKMEQFIKSRKEHIDWHDVFDFVADRWRTIQKNNPTLTDDEIVQLGLQQYREEEEKKTE